MKQRLLGLIPGLVAIAALIGLVGPAVYSQTSVANSPADLAGKILMVADSTTARTVTNLFTFDRGAAAPFAVGASATKVIGLDADKLDGIDSTAFVGSASPTFTGTATFSAITATGATSLASVSATSYTGPVCVPLYVSYTSAANVNTTETTLMTYTLTAGKMAATGDKVRVRAFGTTAANANSKIPRIYFGATVVALYAAGSPNNLGWTADAEIARTGAATQTAFGFVNEGASGYLSPQSTTPAETLSGTVVIKVTGQSGTASNDITATGYSVDFCAAP